MSEKIDKFTAARIRHFRATGIAVQKTLPFDRPRIGRRAILAADVTPRQNYGAVTGTVRTKTA
jgi:hypothetical protein